ncbi:MAG: acetoacetate decarboxylase family protein [Alphaproteobacteria bacterium]|nr:acetoacetate decarboxylase family protein [Alphaproteobacteria bacterium]MDE2042452.1 acetoacetate decarboxylase family protein [Alphaproteobacteria bacterium]MDE2341701.1 acetoacetate decarboxylase family protein [Alphaproteobacteria bacterium]
MPCQINPGSRYRMPIVFGPAIGPRQHPDGRMWTREETGIMECDWMRIAYRTDPAKLERLLPPGFELRGEPILSVSCAQWRNLYWLAGRGYGIVTINFPATYRGKEETVEGSFCPVIWEGRPDAIMTGREELGFSKLFAELPEIDWDKDKGTASCSASWMDFTFFDIALTSLVEEQNPEKIFPESGKGGGPQLYYKYMPRTSPNGVEGADVSYVTTGAPKGTAAANILMDEFAYRRWTGRGSLNWHKATFEQLPLTFKIVNTVADLDILEITEVEMVSFAGPGIAISVNTMRAVEPA